MLGSLHIAVIFLFSGGSGYGVTRGIGFGQDFDDLVDGKLLHCSPPILNGYSYKS